MPVCSLYTEEELALLLSKLAGNGNPDVNVFFNKLLNASGGKLKTALSGMDLKELKITTIPELIHYLLQNADAFHYFSGDLMNALIEMISQSNIDLSKVKELITTEAHHEKGGTGKYFVIFGILAGAVIFLFIYKRRKQKEPDNQ